jgi:hypothetical protein
MVKYTRKVLRSGGRIYPGENAAHPLVMWLNHARTRNGTGHIISLIDALKELNKIGSNLPSASINPHKWGVPIGSKIQFANWTKNRQLVRTIDKILRRYKVRLGRMDFTSYWNPSWILKPNNFKIKIQIVANGDYAEFAFGDADAVTRVLSLAKQGYLIDLRNCNCGNWFYRRFEHQTFCSTPCQRHHHRKTEGFLAGRRQYMRDYRMKLGKRSGVRYRPRPRKKSI